MYGRFTPEQVRAAIEKARVAQATGAPAPVVARRAAAPPVPCRYEGVVIAPCGGCGGNEARHVRDCEIHGTCTYEETGKDVGMTCARCRRESLGYAPAEASSSPNVPTPAPVMGRRHLAYHVHPVPGPVWPLALEQLAARWALFDGVKAIGVTQGPGLEPVERVRAKLPADAHVFAVPNSPALREVATWPHLWEYVLANATDEDAVLYAHAKGVTRKFDPGNACHWWASLMYSLCLDHWPAVAAALARHPVAGPFRKIGRGFANSPSAWHYSGTFFWARAGDFRARPWRAVERVWFGAESWPGIAYTPAEAGELFMSGVVPTLDVYDPKFWEARIRPALAEWLTANPPSWPWVTT